MVHELAEEASTLTKILNCLGKKNTTYFSTLVHSCCIKHYWPVDSRHMHILLNFIFLWYWIVMMSHEPVVVIIIALFYCLSTELFPSPYGCWHASLSPQPDASCCPPFHFSGPLMWSPKLKENPSLLHNSSFLGSSLSLQSLQTSVSLLSLVTEWLCSTTDAFWTPFTNVFLSRDIRGC